MKKNTVYIAGPMRGIPKYNFPAFDHAAERLRLEGYHVINPADLDRLYNDFHGHGEWPDDDPQLQRRVIRRDLLAILDECDAIALLPGWERSRGARVELALAEFLGLEIFTMDDFDNGKVSCGDSGRATDRPEWMVGL